ncbi:MAG: hypothetical protein PVJ76_16445 [Gemmatimonadota bacterium]|jgi:hypothetical protein
MKKRLGSIIMCLALPLFLAPPLTAQLWYFPDFALPSSSGEPATWLAATYGRGLNEASAEVDAFGASIGRTAERVSFMGAFGYISEGDDEFTVGASLGLDLNTGDGPRFSAQVGVGWIDFDFFGETVTFWRFPIGLAVKGNVGSGSTAVTPWVMPRLNIAVASGAGDSETETDPGISGGVSMTTAGGFGVHGALDAWFGDDDTAWQLGLGFHYVLGRQN